jgi:hypothetical protein
VGGRRGSIRGQGELMQTDWKDRSWAGRASGPPLGVVELVTSRQLRVQIREA